MDKPVPLRVNLCPGPGFVEAMTSIDPVGDMNKIPVHQSRIHPRDNVGQVIGSTGDLEFLYLDINADMKKEPKDESR